MTWILLVSQTFFLQTEAEGERKKKKKKRSIEKEQTKLCAAPAASSRRGPSQAHSERALYFGLAVHVSLLDAWSKCHSHTATRKALPANGSIMVIELPYCYKNQPDGKSVKAAPARVKGRHFRVFLNELQPCFFLSFYVWVTSACMQPSRAATQRFAGLPPVGSATSRAGHSHTEPACRRKVNRAHAHRHHSRP